VIDGGIPVGFVALTELTDGPYVWTSSRKTDLKRATA
jgi:hypothetical protein